VDELDRLFECLVQALAQGARVAVPFAAAEIYEHLVPYRSNRSRLRVATFQDYEMTVLRLLAGERGYVRVEPDDVRDGMAREVTSPNPDTALFRNFPDARVMVNRHAAEQFLAGDRVYAPPSDQEEEEPADWTSENPIPPAGFALAEPGDESGGSERCAFCGGSFPGGRDVRFCPHCGQPATGELRCPQCGSDVDVGWSYCITCGRPTGFE